MKAVVFDGNELILDQAFPLPEIGEGEALIRVQYAGICNTDLEITRGYMGFRGVLGHEFVGEVIQAPDSSWVGERVVGEINCYCGDCHLCRRGMETHCPSRTTLGIWGRDGALGQYCTLPIRNLHRVPDVLSDEHAVFTEPLAAAVEILEQAHVRPTDRVLVLGDGKLGLLVAQVLSLLGCDLTCVGHHESKLDILRRGGIDVVLGEPRHGLPADCVIECTGKPEGYALARKWLRPKGRLVLKSTYHGREETDLTSLVVDEIELLGSRCGPFAPALRLLARGLVEVSSLIQATYPLEEALTAFQEAARPGALKVLVHIGE